MFYLTQQFLRIADSLGRQWSVALLILLLPICTPLRAQSIIPAERLCNWSSAGLRETDMPINQSINFVEWGGAPDGLAANDAAFQNLLSNLPDGLVEIYFPEGDYFFKQPLSLPGNILLRGSEQQQSRLLFDLEQADHLIKAEGSTDTLHQTLGMDALALGFAEATHFNNFFKKHTQSSPSKFRSF